VYQVLSCLTTQHDDRLVALAVLICGAAAFASFKIYSYGAASHGLRRASLAVLTGVCSAAGIWATHFIAMLAYDSGYPIAYEPVATTISLLIAVVATTIGFAVAADGEGWQPAAGGAIIGGGIGLMHYTGMSALVLPGTLHWEPGLVAASLAIGVLLASGAVIQFHWLRGRQAWLVAAGLFTLAICGLHFTAMGALTIVPDPTIVVQPRVVDDLLMAFAVSGATLLVMLSGITATALMENQMRRQREEELRVQYMRFDLALSKMVQGLCMFDGEKRLVVCNERYAAMYRLPPELLKPGTPHDAIIAHRVTHGLLKGEQSIAAARRKISALSQLPSNARSTRVDEMADGRLICVTREPMEGGGWVATHDDVTEQRRSEARIIHMAKHDALTDLPNRVLLRERLDFTLQGSRRGHRRLAVLMLDLDRFKEVNDTLGHSTGDALLKAVAGRLRTCVRETDMIARLGGDEFAIIANVAELAVEAVPLAERIQLALREPFDLGDHQASIGVTIGIAIAPNDGTDSERLLRSADLALYRAKAGGRGTHCFFEPEMDRLMLARSDMERDLRRLVANDEFELHYQPLVDLERGEINGFEALLRWNHPVRGMIGPGEFIPLAEETGLIVPIGEWVLRKACAEAARWPANLTIAVNLSPAQFRSPQLVSNVMSALAFARIAPHRLELEVTESVIMQDRDAAFAALGELRQRGVRIALDDFGTGYSSLSFLQGFPFDKVKIDRSFVKELASPKEESRRIAQAVVRFAVSLGKTTTAEGVETKELLDLVRAEGCSEMQGYCYAAAQPSVELAGLLRRQAEKRAALMAWGRSRPILVPAAGVSRI
jgi:diguanylate cyclase (GGDEF)-like protein